MASSLKSKNLNIVVGNLKSYERNLEKFELEKGRNHYVYHSKL